MKLHFFLSFLTLCTLNIFAPFNAYAQQVQTFSKPGVISHQKVRDITSRSCRRLHNGGEDAPLYLETMWRHIQAERTFPLKTYSAINQGLKKALNNGECTSQEVYHLKKILSELKIIDQII